MAKKTSLDSLETDVKQILEQYGNEVQQNLDRIVKDITKKGVQAVQSESAQTFGTTAKRKEKYAKTWTSRVESQKQKFYTTGTIYNKQAGLPHLLENGHVSRNGTGRTFGTVSGRPHISKVEAEIERLFIEEVQSKL